MRRAPGERPRRGHFSAKAETLALVSGNPINGLGETAQRRPSPFFWHPPTMHPFGDLQDAARSRMQECPGFDVAFGKARNHRFWNTTRKEKVLDKSLIRLSGEMTAQQVANLTSKTLRRQAIPLSWQSSALERTACAPF
jgi:hypothetical protein